jgi:hypothetical protein
MAAPGAPYRRLFRLSSLGLLAVVGLTTAASRGPTPHLESQLTAPPSGYVEDTESTGTPIGEFDANAYITYLGPDDPEATTTTLQRAGFVVGYGKSWTQPSTGRGLVEMAVAFSGGQGARRWLVASEVGTRSDPYNKGDITVSGIGPYVGVRYVDPKSSTEADVVQFVKGNDYFLVGFVTDGVDLSGAAAAQSKLQYDFAAAESIPRADWSETARPAQLPPLWALALVGMLVLVGIALSVAMSRRKPSPPGRYWDGQTWRSSDGRLWWDGQTWRADPPAG